MPIRPPPSAKNASVEGSGTGTFSGRSASEADSGTLLNCPEAISELTNTAPFTCPLLNCSDASGARMLPRKLTPDSVTDCALAKFHSTCEASAPAWLPLIDMPRFDSENDEPITLMTMLDPVGTRNCSELMLRTSSALSENTFIAALLPQSVNVEYWRVAVPVAAVAASSAESANNCRPMSSKSIGDGAMVICAPAVL